MPLSRKRRQDQMSQLRIMEPPTEKVDQHQAHLQKVALHPVVKAAAGRIAVIADDVHSIKIVEVVTETTTAAAAIEAAVEDSVNKAAAEVTSKVVAATIDLADHANEAGPVLTTHLQWKNRWRQSLPSQMKN